MSAPTLRPYQEECLDAINLFQSSGGKRGLVVLPTGCGKTRIFSEFPSRFAQNKRTLVLAHREELLEQGKAQLESANPGLWVEIEQADKHASPMAQIVVASVPSIGRESSRRRLARLRPEDFGVIVTDEAHHGTAQTYKRVYEHFGLYDPVETILHQCERADLPLTRAPDGSWDVEKPGALETLTKQAGLTLFGFQQALSGLDNPGAYKVPGRDGAPLHIGVTATPTRTDHIGLEYILDKIVYSKSLKEMIDTGWLVPIRGYRVKTNTDISGVHTQAGDFKEQELSEAVNTRERNAECLHAYQEYCKGRQTMVFCVDVQHTLDMLATYLRGGVKAAVVLGETPRSERYETIEAYHRGDLECLLSCMVLSEGFDDPATSAIQMTRPTGSSLIYTQQIGRGTRIYPGKTDMVVVDMTDTSRRVKLASVATLFGLPPNFDLAGGSATGIADELAKVLQDHPGISLLDVTSRRDIKEKIESFNLFDTDFLDDAVRRYSRLRWIRSGAGDYLLSLAGGMWLSLHENTFGMFAVTCSPNFASQAPVLFTTASEAFRYGDRLVEERAGDQLGLALQNTRWQKDPATDSQVRFLTRLKKQGRLPQVKVGDLGSLRKGQASALISLALGKE